MEPARDLGLDLDDLWLWRAQQERRHNRADLDAIAVTDLLFTTPQRAAVQDSAVGAVQVDDLDATAKELQVAGVKKVPMEMHDHGEREATPMQSASGGAVNLKYLGPDEVHFDVRQKGWDEAIGLGMQRYELTPAKDAAE